MRFFHCRAVKESQTPQESSAFFLVFACSGLHALNAIVQNKIKLQKAFGIFLKTAHH